MKKKLFALVLIAFTAILIQACKKDPGPYPMELEERIKNSSGTVMALLNGKPWVSTLSRAYYWKGDVGIVAEYHLNEDVYEELSIDRIKQLLRYNGIHSSDPYAKGYEDSTQSLFGIVEVDASIADYHVMPGNPTNNYIEITSFDTATQEIKGRFQMTFYRIYTVEKSVYDTVRFTNGAFSLTIK